MSCKRKRGSIADPIKLLDVVALTVDLPEVNLCRGQVGTIVDILAGGIAFEGESAGCCEPIRVARREAPSLMHKRVWATWRPRGAQRTRGVPDGAVGRRARRAGWTRAHLATRRPQCDKT